MEVKTDKFIAHDAKLHKGGLAMKLYPNVVILTGLLCFTACGENSDLSLRTMAGSEKKHSSEDAQLTGNGA